MVEMIKKHGKKTMEAIWKEFDQMISKNVWTIPDNGNQLNQKKTIPSMMLVNEKVDEMGNIKIKARLVAGGNRQHCLSKQFITNCIYYFYILEHFIGCELVHISMQN